ncbi:hypothetical protein GCM10010976_22170 [Bizionia arctica]|uniref:Uncharacterized protein n=1 Tax=Bizionia arctica TaxID=1495645 RepID=A0A917GL90_9FLAO|nr:hypothetical protein GCM10010976_22170 [Bizionia arctica]
MGKNYPDLFMLKIAFILINIMIMSILSFIFNYTYKVGIRVALNGMIKKTYLWILWKEVYVGHAGM